MVPIRLAREHLAVASRDTACLKALEAEALVGRDLAVDRRAEGVSVCARMIQGIRAMRSGW